MLSCDSSNIAIGASEFHNNSATGGGVLSAPHRSNITLEVSEFHANCANYRGGGVLYSQSSSAITIQASKFHDNSDLAHIKKFGLVTDIGLKRVNDTCL